MSNNFRDIPLHETQKQSRCILCHDHSPSLRVHLLPKPEKTGLCDHTGGTLREEAKKTPERSAMTTILSQICADKFLVLELGEITCKQQTDWLAPRCKKIAKLIANAIATELDMKIKKRSL